MCIDDRHTIDWASRIVKGCRVNYVIGTYNYGYICHRHLWVHFIRCLKLLIRDVSLCKKNIHVSRHSSCNRVDGKVYFRAIILKLFCKFLNCMLSLRNRHTVTRYKYYILSCFKYHISIFCRNSLCFSTVSTCTFTCSTAKAAKEKAVEASIHCLTHDKSKDES